MKLLFKIKLIESKNINSKQTHNNFYFNFGIVKPSVSVLTF